MSAPSALPPSVPEGTTRRLLQLCGGYYFAYVLTGITVKWFTGGLRNPGMSDVAFLFDNTLGSSLICVLAVIALGWLRVPSAAGRRRWLGMTVPQETPYIVASGVCTAVIIPATTLLYTLPISVMVAMVIMRGSVIVISRVVDAVLARRGLLKRPVRAEENWAVVLALLAVGLHVLLLPISAMFERWAPGFALAQTTTSIRGGFEFARSMPALVVLGLYVLAYSVRLYWMNVFKLTRAAGPALDNRGYFAIEQIVASITMALVTAGLVAGTRSWGWTDPRLLELSREATHPDAWAIVSGIPYALVAFFSVFLFMFQGRTATFAGVANRLTSLLGGTTATLLLALAFRLPPPSPVDWISLVLVMTAVFLLARVERSRKASVTPMSQQDHSEQLAPHGQQTR